MNLVVSERHGRPYLHAIVHYGILVNSIGISQNSYLVSMYKAWKCTAFTYSDQAYKYGKLQV